MSKLYDKLFDIVILSFYNEMFPIENMDYTASQVNGRTERAIDLYETDCIFSDKVNMTVAEIMAFIKELPK